LYYLRDCRHVLEPAVQNALEARKPLYDEFPQRISIQSDLIASYLFIDPLGYVDLILQALEYVESQIRPEWESYYRYLFLEHRRTLALALKDYEKAHDLCLEALAFADADQDGPWRTHYSISIYS